ncbi:MAG: indolepyruvate oxidoreductase subunit beta [Spirochaetaceae bacterium]|nr:indolepyruvate oxidoreductase subunit beta [Spirochaetaceae bacterium]
MNYNIILAGVGGQGSLSVSVVIANAAMKAGLQVKQSEVHGMSQRGGEVLANLRLSDSQIQSPTVPRGMADLVLAFEPLEALRYIPWLNKERGVVVSASQPIRNIVDYPEIDSVLAEIRHLPRFRIIDADGIAKAAGNPRAANIVLVGAAADLLPIPISALESAIDEIFARKGEAVIQANRKAFNDGKTQFGK